MRLPRVFLCFVLLLTALFSACQEKLTSPSHPQIILWAWERPENLEFLNPEKFAVAFLAQTVELSGDEVKIFPRRQPLKIPPHTTLIAVTRIEVSQKSTFRPSLSAPQRQQIRQLILATLNFKDVTALQIDFDAAVSEREFYRDLLQDLRAGLPENTGLSMTALASWCLADNWIRGLPVDEAVPMAFEMGADEKTIRDYLSTGQDWHEPLCRKSYGISLTEVVPGKFKPNRKFYLFNYNPKGWKKSDLDSLPAGVKS